MNNKKIVPILLITLAVVILGLIIFFLFFYKFPQATKAPANEEIKKEQTAALPKEEGPTVKQAEVKSGGEPAKSEEINLVNLEKQAMSFTERFGSYSNQSDYENMKDLKIFMTAKMQKWADEYIKKSRETSDSSGAYEGLITRSLAVEIKKSDSSRAEMLIKTQQTKISGQSSAGTVNYKDLLLVMLKEKGVWKVDSAYWQ